MGIWGTIANVAGLAKDVYGTYSASRTSSRAQDEASRVSADQSELLDQYKKMYNLEEERYRDEQAMREYVKGLAEKQMAYAKQIGNSGLYQAALATYNDILAGKFPSGLFHNIANEMDYELVSKIQSIDRQAKNARDQIATQVPDGGVRTRLLAEVARNTTELKAAAMRETAQERRKTYTNTYKELFGEALKTGKGLINTEATIMQNAIGTVAGMQGARTPTMSTGPSSILESQMTGARTDYKEAADALGSYGKALEGRFDDWTKEPEQPIVSSVPGQTQPQTQPNSNIMYTDNWARFNASG